MIDFLPFVLLKTNINLQNMLYCLGHYTLTATPDMWYREIQDAFPESAALPSTMAPPPWQGSQTTILTRCTVYLKAPPWLQVASILDKMCSGTYSSSLYHSQVCLSFQSPIPDKYGSSCSLHACLSSMQCSCNREWCPFANWLFSLYNNLWNWSKIFTSWT